MLPAPGSARQITAAASRFVAASLIAAGLPERREMTSTATAGRQRPHCQLKSQRTSYTRWYPSAAISLTSPVCQGGLV